MLKGHLDMIVLTALAEGPAHGYAVIQEIRRRGGGAFDLPEGTIYPALHRLEQSGLLNSRWTAGVTEKGKLLSLSFFRDEAAIEAWRNVSEHRRSQAKGRARIFEDYRIRIAGVVRDYGMNERAQAPKDSRALHDAH